MSEVSGDLCLRETPCSCKYIFDDRYCDIYPYTSCWHESRALRTLSHHPCTVLGTSLLHDRRSDAAAAACDHLDGLSRQIMERGVQVGLQSLLLQACWSTCEAADDHIADDFVAPDAELFETALTRLTTLTRLDVTNAADTSLLESCLRAHLPSLRVLHLAYCTLDQNVCALLGAQLEITTSLQCLSIESALSILCVC